MRTRTLELEGVIAPPLQVIEWYCKASTRWIDERDLEHFFKDNMAYAAFSPSAEPYTVKCRLYGRKPRTQGEFGYGECKHYRKCALMEHLRELEQDGITEESLDNYEDRLMHHEGW